MAKHGSIGEYKSEIEEWPAYAERLQHYFTANDVTNGDKKRAILLSVCGAGTYGLIRSLVQPKKPTEFSYSQLVEKVKKHYNPRPSAIVQRFKFNSLKRQPGETVAHYVAELRKLTEYCDFGDTLDDMLRDKLVWGIEDSRTQERLLAEDNLTFSKALDLAQALEVAAQDSKELSASTPAMVHKVQGFAPGPSNRSQRRKTTDATSKPPSPCYRCGGQHWAARCRFKSEKCNACGKVGHIAKMCRTKTKRGHTTHMVDNESTSADEYTLYSVVTQKSPASSLRTTVLINNSPLVMEVDTGAACSLISEATFNKLWDSRTAPPLQPSGLPLPLRTYTGEPIRVLGSVMVTVNDNQQEAELPLLVVGGDGPSLLGRNWLSSIRLDWKRILSIRTSQGLESILEQHKDVFKSELGTLNGVEAKIHIDPQAKPIFYKARTVPLAFRQKVERELERLEKQGIIEPVQFSDWAAPIVPVEKRDGNIRICGDYKLTVNQAAQTEVYPIPLIQEIFASLSGGKTFSKLDLSHAYQQVKLEEASQQYVTVNTHKGLFRYKRLPFGISSAPAIFQRMMETLLQGIPGVCVYIDDIIVTGKTDEEHLHHLEEVLSRLEKAGMRLKKEKCRYMLPEVEYLSHKINREGLQPSDSKVAAIVEAPPPKNVSELKSFLGMVNYYGKFLPNLSTTLAPLYRLLRKETLWQWGDEEQQAFDKVKKLLQSPNLLVHFDGDKPIVLACDASPYGVGAVLSHRMEDGSDRPIAFASRTLAPVEKRYSHLDKEALAIVFGVKHFHQYIYGRPFVILSDHKPLMHILSESKATPAMASARLQRWALLLGGYDYRIEYKAGAEQANADALSRLPCSSQPSSVPTPPETVHLMEHLASTPVTASQIKLHTDRDPLLSKVKQFVQQGWPDRVNSESTDMQPYERRKNELSLHDGCLLWGGRVVIPPQLRDRVVSELHEAHPGIVKMKVLARQYVWWPGIDAELEKKVKNCDSCQSVRQNPAHAQLHPWEWPQRPWSRVHADYAGPFLGKMFLILVDAHTKWMDVHLTSSSTSQLTIEKMRATFATLGIPEMLVTDNGTAFTSTEFAQFAKQNGIRHVTTSPYHPASNGLAERAVKTFKEGMKKLSSGSLETRISRFLFKYRSTPQATTGVSPAELMFGRPLRSQLDLMRPSIQSHVMLHQEQQKYGHDKRAKERNFKPGDLVYVRNFTQGTTWLTGTVVEVRGPVSYTVRLEDGRVVRRHVDHLRTREVSDTTQSNSAIPNWDNTLSAPSSAETDSESDPSVGADHNQDGGSQATLRHSSRTRRPPDRYSK